MVLSLLAAFLPLAGVGIGAWLTSVERGRSWRRDEQLRVREERRAAYSAFLVAVREYVAYAQGVSANISARRHPSNPDFLIPVLDDVGTKFRQQMDAAHIGIRMVASNIAIVEAGHAVAKAVRQMVASRASHDAGQVPVDIYEAVWKAEHQFVDRIRAELDLDRLTRSYVGPP